MCDDKEIQGRLHISPTVEHGGGSLQVWGSITFNEVGLGHLQHRQYQFRTYTQADSHPRSCMCPLEQDYDPKHTARVIKKYLENKRRDSNLKFLNWPLQSPDINVIEHVWTFMQKRAKRAPANLQQM